MKKKLISDLIISSLITFGASILLYLLAPILGNIIPVEITSALITMILFPFIFVWYRYARSGEGDKIVHKDYPAKTGGYSVKNDLMLILKEERAVLASFVCLTLASHIILDLAFYFKAQSVIITGVELLLFPFGISNSLLHYFNVPDNMFILAAIILFVVNVVLICMFYVIVLSVRRHKWTKEWMQ